MTIAALLTLSALGASPEAILERVHEVAPLRVYRMAAGAPAIPDRDYALLASGKPVTGLESVEGYAARKAWGAKVIPVPIGELWAAINDVASHPRYTRLSYSELLSGEACESGRKLLQFMPLPMVANRWWITNLRINTALWRQSSGRIRELAWQSSDDLESVRSEKGRAMVEQGIPLAFSKGGWLLVDLDGTATLTEYYVWSDPGGKLPAGATSAFAAGGIKDAFDAMEKLAHDGPGCPVE